MDAIFDRSGNTVGFLTGMRIVSPAGASLAWVDGSGNVYAYDGRHLGWWGQGHMRGHDGGVMAWMRGCAGLGMSPPPPRRLPAAPRPELEPHRHDRATPPPRPLLNHSWSTSSLAAE